MWGIQVGIVTYIQVYDKINKKQNTIKSNNRFNYIIFFNKQGPGIYGAVG